MTTFSDKLNNYKKIYEGFVEKLNEDSTNAVSNMIESGDVYTSEGLIKILSEQLNGIKSEFETQAQGLNIQINDLIQNEKSKHLPSDTNQSTDYSMKINNAIRFMEIEGSTLDDEKAAFILKDFQDDHSTMKLFKRMIEKQIGSMGNVAIQDFKKTFNKYNEVESLLNTFNEMESTAKDLFVNPLNERSHSVLRGHRFVSSYMPSYTDRAYPIRLIDLAEIVESMTDTE